MKRLILLFCILIGLPCFADTAEILRSLTVQEQQVLNCKTNCNEQMTRFYKNLIEHVYDTMDEALKLDETESKDWFIPSQAPFIYVSCNCWVGVGINYKHLKTYKLPKIWKEYLNVFNDVDVVDLYAYDELQGVRFIKKADKFIQKYPDFPFNYYLKEQRDNILKSISGNLIDFPYPPTNKRVIKFCKSMGIDF